MHPDDTPTLTTCVVCGRVIDALRKDGSPKRYCSSRCVGIANAVPIEDRFWQKVDQSGGTNACWEWQASRLRTGYGTVRAQGKVRKAHRVAWELIHGPIPEGLLVCHHCDNPPCVNPSHLFLGTDADNSADRDRKGRRSPARGSQSGVAKLTENDVRQILQMLAEGWKLKPIAERFGVDFTLISMIKRGLIWKHVPRH